MTDRSHCRRCSCRKEVRPTPTQTFLNLPEEKRRRFLDIAIDEFAHHHYRSASISRVVARAGIAKGSFYQYFRDKKDLHQYLVELAVKAKLEYLLNHPETGRKEGFFAKIRGLFQANADFEVAAPKLNRLLTHVVHGDMPDADDNLQRVLGIVQERVKALVREAAARGDIRPDLDQDLVSFVITALVGEFGNYLARRLPAAQPSDQSKQHLFEQLVTVLEQGIAAPAPSQG